MRSVNWHSEADCGRGFLSNIIFATQPFFYASLLTKKWVVSQKIPSILTHVHSGKVTSISSSFVFFFFYSDLV
jgi:hypothetical protein